MRPCKLEERGAKPDTSTQTCLPVIGREFGGGAAGALGLRGADDQAGMLALIVRLHNEGVLPEGHVARATGLRRITNRRHANHVAGRIALEQNEGEADG